MSWSASELRRADIDEPRILSNMKIILKCAAAAVLFSLLGTASALAQHACHDDAFRFCGKDIPDHDKIHACLVRHVKHLHPHCKAVIKPKRR
jgi:hypothetical protein